MFFQQIEVGTDAVFAYLIGDPEAGDAVVVDPADDVDELIRLAQKNRMTISRIINTHGHVDHVMGNAEMKEKTGADILIHKNEAEYLTKIGDYWLNMFNARKSPRRTAFYKTMISFESANTSGRSSTHRVTHRAVSAFTVSPSVFVSPVIPFLSNQWVALTVPGPPIPG